MVNELDKQKITYVTFFRLLYFLSLLFTLSIIKKFAMTYYYQAFGLNIASEMMCPLLENSSDQIDITIQFGKVPEQLTRINVWYENHENQLLLKIPGVARFLIDNGSLITVDAQCDDLNHIRLFLLGSVLGVAMQQRGRLVLHANGIVINDKAILIMAEQGFGKSTLAAAFLKKGFAILSDDVCSIEIKAEGAIIYPGYPQIKLCADVLQPLGFSIDQLKPIGYDTHKFYVPIHDNFSTKSLSIGELIFLDKHAESTCSWKNVMGYEKFKTLMANTYRLLFMDTPKLMAHHFNQCAALGNQVPIKKICRPEKGFTAFHLVDEILNAYY